MMKTLLLIFIVASFSIATAVAEQKVDVNIPAGGAQDLLNMTTIPQSITNKEGDHTMTTACTNAQGRVVYQDEEGYQRCIDSTEHHKKTVPQPANVANDPAGSHIITIPGLTKPGN